MPRTLLALMYNHRYEANVPRLSAMYQQQFDDVVHLMPFSDSRRQDIIPVYESSYRFGNFVAQALPALLAHAADFFVFAGDDLLLSPALTSASICPLLGVSTDTGFLKDWAFLNKTSWWWYHVHRGYAPLADEHSGVEWRNQLPERDEAARRFEAFGWHDRPMTLANFVIPPPVLRSRRAAGRAVLQILKRGGRVHPQYPLAMGYADIFVIPRAHLVNFARFVGVLSATGVFAEVAVPTAMLLALPNISTSKGAVVGGREYWTPEDIETFERRYGTSIPTLRKAMVEDGVLWHHPVKLSRWSDS